MVYYITSVLQLNVGLDRNLSLLLGGVINLMYVTGTRPDCAYPLTFATGSSLVPFTPRFS